MPPETQTTDKTPAATTINDIRLAICATRGGWKKRRKHELQTKWNSMTKDQRAEALAAVAAWKPDERKLMESKLEPLDSLEPKQAAAKAAPPAKTPPAK